MAQDTNNATEQATIKAGKGGVIPPKNRQFGQPNGNPRNNGGVPKYVREIREELKGLLDPNLSISDYQKIVKDAETDSGLMGVFATAIVRKDYKTIIQLIDQAYGYPKQSVEQVNLTPPPPLSPRKKLKLPKKPEV